MPERAPGDAAGGEGSTWSCPAFLLLPFTILSSLTILEVHLGFQLLGFRHLLVSII
jgi:hypothetical protein